MGTTRYTERCIFTSTLPKRIDRQQVQKDIKYFESMAAYYQRMADYSKTLLRLKTP